MPYNSTSPQQEKHMVTFDEKRYEKTKYRRCGRSGLMLPEISVGF